MLVFNIFLCYNENLLMCFDYSVFYFVFVMCDKYIFVWRRVCNCLFSCCNMLYIIVYLRVVDERIIEYNLRDVV